MKKSKKYSFNSTNIVIKVIIYLIFLIIVFNIAPNYESNNYYIEEKINIIIDNINVTNDLKHDLFIDEKNVIYISTEDIANYFDKTITYDKNNNQIITTYGEKTVKLPLNENIIKINERVIDVLSGATQKDNIYYVPITALKTVYELDVEYIEENKILLLDSLTKKLVKADVSKECSVKYMATTFSKTVDKLKKGEKVVCVEKVNNKWTKVRTQKGRIGYIKTKILQNEIYIRKDVILQEDSNN